MRLPLQDAPHELRLLSGWMNSWTGVRPGEWLPGTSHHHRTARLLLDVTVLRPLDIRQPEGSRRPVRVKPVVRLRVGDECRALTGAPEAFDILAARPNRRPVVRLAVEDPNRAIAHILLAEEAALASGIERDVAQLMAHRREKMARRQTGSARGCPPC